MTTPTEIAQWLLHELRCTGLLPQQAAALGILERFGPAYVTLGRKGRPVIRREVLAEFRQYSQALAVWDPGKKYWRLRSRGDCPERRRAGP